MRPIIGITTYLGPARWGRWDRVAAVVSRTYLDGVVRAGGVAVLLPPNLVADSAATSDSGDSATGGHSSAKKHAAKHTGADEHAAYAPDALRTIDALILSGGADVDPVRYGEPLQPRTVISIERDAWEFALLHAALDRGLPVLAICRGMQLLNVAHGGTLLQHLPDAVGHDRHLPRPGTFGRTSVRTAPGSRLASILGTEVQVSCHHHQALHRLGEGLTPSAWATDGTVEAIEHGGHPFVLGVQWHPEQDQQDRRLFEALVQAA